MLRSTPNLLARRAHVAAGLLALAVAFGQPSIGAAAAQAGLGPATTAVELRATLGGTYEERRVELTRVSGERLVLTLLLQPDHVHHAERIIDAATEAVRQYEEWFAPYPHDQLAIVDVPWRSGAGGQTGPGFLTIQARWLQPDRSFTLEAQVARGIARQWWGGIIRVEDRFLADGLAEYAQSRTLERIYDRRHQRVSYSTYETRVLGGLVPWAIRALRLDRETTGIKRADFRRHPDVDLTDVREALRPAQAGKTAAALVTLERYLGWPTLQRGLSAAARRYAGQTMTTKAFAATVGDAADRDLWWFFDQAFWRRATFDYSVGQLSSEVEPAVTCGGDSCYRSTIVLHRVGDAAFTGTSLEPVGDFEAGRAIEIGVNFADGQVAADHWDGRAQSKTLTYVSVAPPVSASIDPRRVLVLDLKTLNNHRTRTPAAAGPRLPWSVRWTTWLQDVMLTHAFFF